MKLACFSASLIKCKNDWQFYVKIYNLIEQFEDMYKPHRQYLDITYFNLIWNYESEENNYVFSVSQGTLFDLYSTNPE